MMGFFLICALGDLNRKGRTQRNQRQIDFDIRTNSEDLKYVYVLCSSDG